MAAATTLEPERAPAAASTPFAGLGYSGLAAAGIAAVTAVRLLCIATLPLGNGEAYYAVWARFPSLSYYDHPPLLAWMVWLTTRLGATAFTARIGPVACAALFGILFFRLARELVGPRAALLGLAVVTACPVFLVSSFVLNPEAPLAPLWMATLLAVWNLRQGHEAWRPLLAGALLGLAFLAKYSALLLVPATFLYLVTSPDGRRWLTRPSFLLAGAVALGIALPVILWNVPRGWPSLALHFGERNEAAGPVPGENPFNDLVGSASGSPQEATFLAGMGRTLVGQLMAYSPLLSPLLAWALFASLRGARARDADRFLAIFGWVALVPLLVAMVKIKDSEQHWTMMALAPAAMGAGRILDGAWDSARWPRRVLGAGLALSAGLFAGVNVHAHSAAILRVIPPSDYDAHADIVNELLGWDEVRRHIAAQVDAQPFKVVLASTHYSLCGKMMFETADSPQTYCPTVRRTEFDFLDRRHPPDDSGVLVLTSGVHSHLPAELEDRRCQSVDQVDIRRADRVVAHYQLTACPPRSAEGPSAVHAQPP